MSVFIRVGVLTEDGKSYFGNLSYQSFNQLSIFKVINIILNYSSIFYTTLTLWPQKYGPKSLGANLSA